MRKNINRLCISIVGIVCALIVGEILVRILHIQHPLDNEWLLYSQDKKISSRYIFEKKYSIDTAASSSGKLVVIGDSFSEKGLWKRFGIESYPEILSAMIAPLSVYNFALGAVGPDQELRYFIDNILPLQPKIVMWQFYANDVMDNVIQPVYAIDTQGKLEPIDASLHWMYLRQKVYGMLPFPSLLMHSRLLKEVLYAFELTKLKDVPVQYRHRPQDWGIEKTKLEIDTMNRLASKHGFTVLYVLISPQATYLGEHDAKLPGVTQAISYDKAIDGLLISQAHYVHILFDQMNGLTSTPMSKEQILNTIYLHQEDSNAFGDKHLSQLGHELVAKQIFDLIQSIINSKQ